jgi:S-adenosyl-L-methionine hydrolase (adenosine-forming)
MPRPLITLLTDFGSSDPYVGVMKGVIFDVCPDAVIVDLTHEVQPFEIAEGGFLLAQSWLHFPNGTVHLAVVDPGVGSRRRPVVVEAGGHFFVGPDNGLFSMVFAAALSNVRHVTASKYFRDPVSSTFHGRDIFAPVAAHLANGVTAAKFGRTITDYTRLDFFRPVRSAKRAWTGTVLHIDRFGNIVTNFLADEFRERMLEMRTGLQSVNRAAEYYADVPFGELFVVAGSSGFLEISVNQGSAARVLGVGLGAPLELRLR